jgi:RNA polymerase sigma-70 factor (ECF subfamily)
MYRKYYRRMVVFFMRAFRVSEEDAEELTQDAYVRFFRAMDEYRGEAEWAFLETIARNVGLNRVRSLNTQRRGVTPLNIDDRDTFRDGEPAAPAEPDYADRDEEARRKKLLYDEINRLPARQRQCVLLWLDGFKYNEIARALRITLDAVRSAIRDARRTLLEKLGDGVELPEDDQ